MDEQSYLESAAETTNEIEADTDVIPEDEVAAEGGEAEGEDVSAEVEAEAEAEGEADADAVPESEVAAEGGEAEAEAEMESEEMEAEGEGEESDDVPEAEAETESEVSSDVLEAEAETEEGDAVPESEVAAEGGEVEDEAETEEGDAVPETNAEVTSESETTLAQVDSGTTSVFLDLATLESAAGITLVEADSEGEAFSEDFQVGFPIEEDSYFTYETDSFAPVSGSVEHSGTITLGVEDEEVTVGDFSIGFDAGRVSETASGFFVADTTEDDLELEILFDVGAPGSVSADAESLEISEADLLVAPELAEALESEELAGADVGDTRIDASAIEPEITIGETTALIPQAGSSYAPEDLQDGGSGDTDFPYGDFKALATIGEIDPNNGLAMTGYPDGQAAWLLDEDTVRVAYQSESYGTLGSSEGETYPWVMDSGATFTGSHIHTIDYDRAAFADFLNNDSAASEMFQGAGQLFNTVYNVFGEEVTGKNFDTSDLGAKWGNQTLADGTVVEFNEDQQLSFADWFFHSFCGAYYEEANKYGEGIGFEDNVWLMGEEWNIGELYEEAALAAGMTEEEARLSPGADFFTETMGLASMVVDVENETAYTVPALGQSGYEKILPINSGHEDYVVLVAAGYNLEIEPSPMKIYIGKKGVDANGDPLAEDANERDSFLGRNGLLYGQLYGMAAANETLSELGIEEIDADAFMLDEYAVDEDAPENFSVRYVPTSYQWDGFDTPENANETEVFLWEQDGDTLEDGTVEANEQPDGYTFFNGDSKTEHPAVDPDITKHRYIQNLTVPSAQLGVDFVDIVNELENNDADGNGLPDYLSADVTRLIAGVDGALTLETGGKGKGHIGPNNPDGTLTHATHLEVDEARMDQPDGLQWIKTSEGDYLVVDEDSGNDYGERKYVLPIDAETMQLRDEGKGYFLASAGGELNPRAIAEVSAIPDTFTRATSSEFSGTWNVTHLVQTKEDGSFYSQEELAGTGAQEIIEQFSLDEQTLIGVVQHRGESDGVIRDRQGDQGGQIFQFNINGLSESEEEENELTPVSGEIAEAEAEIAEMEEDSAMMPEESDIESQGDAGTDSGTAKNVIIMIGDGMGWEMARAAAIQKMINEGAEGDTLTDFYTEGVGEGLSFQELEGYVISTTSNTYIDGDKGNSALEGDPFDHNTGESEVREGFEFNPNRALVQGFFPEIRDPAPEESEEASDGVTESVTEFVPGFNPENGFNEEPLELANGEVVGGNVPIYNPELGGALPWLDGEDPEYIKNLYPDSAGTATSLYTGVKTYVGAIGVDIFEESVETLAEAVKDESKSAGVVSSVPFNHATPAAAIAHVNQRNKNHGESFEQANGEDEEFRNEAGELVDEFGHEIADNDNIFTQIVEEVQPDLVLGAGHADTRDGDERYITYDQLDELRNGEYPYTFLERGENAAEVLAETASEIDVEAGDNLFGIYGARGQGGNLPWRTANDDYSNTGLPGRLDVERPLEEGETDESFIETELDANPTLMDMTLAALDVLEDDQDGFWLSIEGGDIDWAAHDNNLDNMLGTTMDFAESVEIVMDWIEENGGYEETQLIVTADHDHYFTLTEDYPELLREQGAEALTVQVGEDGEPLTETNEDGELVKVDNEDVSASGHYWGSDSNEKYGWGTHTTRPVPVYYQGVGSEYFEEVTGEGYEAYGEEVAGVDGFIDQVHIAEAQFNAFGLTPEENRDVINLITEENLSVNVSAEVDAGFENVGGFYRAIDAEGTVIDPINGEEIVVGGEGYEAAALASSVTLLGDGETATLDLEAGSVYVPYLLADGDQFFSSFAGANPQGIDHVQSLGDNSFGFEDLVGGGDGDFNDFVLTAETV